ncbi:hypothetical protein EK904_002023 [Melospiza melodia maxima]|nr:hypothetical protein EK904_002023 [Melospiza melodia maxima]
MPVPSEPQQRLFHANKLSVLQHIQRTPPSWLFQPCSTTFPTTPPVETLALINRVDFGVFFLVGSAFPEVWAGAVAPAAPTAPGRRYPVDCRISDQNEGEQFRIKYRKAAGGFLPHSRQARERGKRKLPRHAGFLKVLRFIIATVCLGSAGVCPCVQSERRVRRCLFRHHGCPDLSVQPVQEDFRSPTTSAFISCVDHCKATDNSMEKKSRGGMLQGCSLKACDRGHPEGVLPYCLSRSGAMLYLLLLLGGFSNIQGSFFVHGNLPEPITPGDRHLLAEDKSKGGDVCTGNLCLVLVPHYGLKRGQLSHTQARWQTEG